MAEKDTELSDLQKHQYCSAYYSIIKIIRLLAIIGKKKKTFAFNFNFAIH